MRVCGVAGIRHKNESRGGKEKLRERERGQRGESSMQVSLLATVQRRFQPFPFYRPLSRDDVMGGSVPLPVISG